MPTWDSFRSFAPPSVLPDISPTRGEIGCRDGFRQSPALQKERRAKRPADLPPCGGDVRQDRGGREGAQTCPTEPVRVWIDSAPHLLPMKKVPLQKQSTTSNPQIFFTPFYPHPSAPPLSSSPSLLREPVRTGDQEERRRPPSPGYGALEIRGPATGRRYRGGGCETPPPEKRMLGESRHRGNRGEAARVSSTGPAKTTP